jgi:hypothetical protein
MTKKVNIDIVARDKTKRAVEQSKKGLGGIKTAALAASAALASIGAGRVISNLVRVGKEVESLQVRFKFLFGTAEEGTKAFDNLADFAAKVPFSLEEIAAASGNLAVVSKDANDLSRILEITGNVAAVTGLDFLTTASQIQRAFSGGIAAADVFREKGVRALLGFEQGAKVSIEQTVERFEEVFSGQGRFANATDDLAQTLEGTLSMINDKFFKFQQSVNKSFFEELKLQFGDLNDALERNEATIERFGESIGENLAQSLSNAVTVINFINESLGLLARSLDKVGGNDTFNKFFAIATSQTEIFGAIVQEVINDLGGLANIFAETIPVQQQYQDQILRISEGYGLLKESTEEVDQGTINLKDTYEDLLQKHTLSKPYQEMGLAINDAISSIEALTFAQQEVEQGFMDQKKASAEAHRVEKEGVKSRKEGLEETGRALKAFAAEGAKRSKKMFRLQQAVQIGEAIMNTYAGASKALATLPPPFSFAVAALTVATGLAQVANIRSQQPPAQFGGARQANQPFLVGEKGAELFTPATAGTVTPNHQLGDKMGATVVNFNINTVSAKGFNELLNNSRGMITNMINQAVNEKGKANLI